MNSSTKADEKHRKKIIDALKAKSNGRCEYCGKYVGVEHLIGHEIFGGRYRRASIYVGAIALVCSWCNGWDLEGHVNCSEDFANRQLCEKKKIDYDALYYAVRNCNVKQERLKNK